jgi:carboxylate-amine ligase
MPRARRVRSRAMRANFTGPSYTVGVEEELMIVDDKSYGLVNAIESLLEDAGASNLERQDGEIKPELMESVLEIATKPCADVTEAGRQLRSLRHNVREAAAGRGLAIGSAGTHPFAMWEDQRIVARPRYRDLISALRFVARQELIFGMHVHVGLDDADKAIHVANGMRVHVPVLLALSANSPFWRGDRTGLLSTRTPIFRQFPRVGMPPAYKDWDDWERNVAFMVSSGVMEDYTYLWYDVRPHPNLGTVEIRVCDSQTRVEHTVALTALIQAMVHELAEHFDAGTKLAEYPWQMLDENKWLAARHGLEGEIVDLPSNERVTTKALTKRLLERLEPHAQQLGGADALDGIRDVLERGNGAARQIVVYEANTDLNEVMAEIIAATAL